MTSVERIQQYNRIPPEAPSEIPEKKPDPSWPFMGSIEFKNACFAYYDEGPIVLNSLNFEIRAKEKVSRSARCYTGSECRCFSQTEVHVPFNVRIVHLITNQT